MPLHEVQTEGKTICHSVLEHPETGEFVGTSVCHALHECCFGQQPCLLLPVMDDVLSENTGQFQEHIGFVQPVKRRNGSYDC